jgi:FlaA1/EpsC-like NDP-sugar epimerase
MFQKSENSLLFEKYISEGSQYLENVINKLPNIQNRVFLYGCGQLLYKLINKLQQKYNILYVIDNNANLKGKYINSIKIISLEDYAKIQLDSDTIIITSKQHSANMIARINDINLNISTLVV